MWRNKRKSENSEIFMEWQELRRKVPNVCNWDDGCLPFLNKRFNNSFNKKLTVGRCARGIGIHKVLTLALLVIYSSTIARLHSPAGHCRVVVECHLASPQRSGHQQHAIVFGFARHSNANTWTTIGRRHPSLPSSLEMEVAGHANVSKLAQNDPYSRRSQHNPSW